MPSNYTSPFASSFKSAVNRGTSWNTAVWNLAKKHNKTPEFIWNSLFKAGLCDRQKFNGQWIYFPTNCKKGSATNWKNSQFNTWQWFCEWALMNGWCTPTQLSNNCGSQQDFMNYCKKFWSKQFSPATSTSKKNTTGTKSNKTTGRKSTLKSKTKNYKFPTGKSRTTKKYSAAA